MKGQGKPKGMKKGMATVMAVAKALESQHKRGEDVPQLNTKADNLGGDYSDMVKEPRTKMQRIKRKRSKAAKRARRTQRRSS